MAFFTRLQARIDAIDSLLCVGLDPHTSDLPAATPAAAYDFCAALIAATAPFAACYKPNAAFFEVFGPPGLEALARVIAAVPDGIPVLLDAKRGDISTTAEAYAAACYTALGADAVTINGYMGVDSVAPFTADPAKGVFVLCKTSNPSSGELQALTVVGGGGGPAAKVYEVVAKLAAGAWNTRSNVGVVVGATDVEALASVRRIGPALWILAPGVGFQGGDLRASLAAGLSDGGSCMLLPVSRGISRAPDAGVAAKDLRDEINAVRRAVVASRAAARASPATVSAAPSPHATAFLTGAVSAGVLKFGSFTLKSGRVSPYFFNAGAFSTGGSLRSLGAAYAAAIQASAPPFDVLFGPAYKGIPLVAATALALAEGGRDLPFAYNRKEAKDHGEGGTMVGAPLTGKRVLIIDDVISAGTAVGEAVALIVAAGGVPAGVVIGLDRQERGGGEKEGGLSAVQGVTAAYGIPVVAVATLADLVGMISGLLRAGQAVPGLPAGMSEATLLESIQAYRATWGV